MQDPNSQKSDQSPAQAIVNILLVEDNPGDVRLAQEAFKNGGLMIMLHVVRDGEAAMEFLYRRGKYINAPIPNIVLLDLNLPKKNGAEVLKEIKTSEQLKRIPVAVLTTSQSHDDITRSYDLGANCYLTKPVDLEKFRIMINSLRDFWFKSVHLPT